MDTYTALGREWTTLQNNHERYEGGALLVKITAVVLFFAGAAIALDPWLTGLLMLVLWLQEGIFKTSQARLGARILRLEQMLREDPADPGAAPFQLHSEWLAARSGSSGLLAEYARSACRPTVAFPYGLLLLVVVVLAI